MRIKKVVLSLLLCVSLVLSITNLPAFAAAGLKDNVPMEDSSSVSSNLSEQEFLYILPDYYNANRDKADEIAKWLDTKDVHSVNQNQAQRMYKTLVASEETPTSVRDLNGFDYAAVSALSGGKFSEEALRKFVNDLKGKYIPTMLGAITNTFSSATPTVEGLEIGLTLYNSSTDGTLASVLSNGVGYELKINMAYLVATNEKEVDPEGNGGMLYSAIAHEMMHAVMFDITTAGLTGKETISNGEVVESVDQFPLWFIEGVAQTVGGGIDYSTELTHDLYNRGEDKEKATKEWLSKLDNSIYESYAQGYIATLYLGYMAGGEGTITSGNIAKGLDHLLSDVSNGYSLSEAIYRQTNGIYTSIEDFKMKFAEDAYSFSMQLVDVINPAHNGSGSIVAAGGLSASKIQLYSQTKQLSNFFTLNIEKSGMSDNSALLEGRFIYTGGGATKTEGKDRNGKVNSAATLHWTSDSASSSVVSSKRKYTVTLSTYPAEGGTVTGDGNYDEHSSVTVTASVYNGYRFVHWSEDGIEVSKDASYQFEAVSDRVLIAVFEANSYTVSFDANGGTVTPTTMSTNTDGKLPKLPVPFHSDNYSFVGWYTEPRGGNLIATTDVFSSDTTVYAHWTHTGNNDRTVSAGSIGNTFSPLIPISPVNTVSTMSTGIAERVASTESARNPDATSTESSTSDQSSIITGEQTNVNGSVSVDITDEEVQDASIETQHEVNNNRAITNFTDITNHWAKKYIEHVVDRKLFTGTSSTTFSPQGVMTRGMFVTVLGRLAGVDESDYKTSSFSDVETGSYYYGYIEWASKNDIVKGIGDGKFGVDQAITREQMAVIIVNYATFIDTELPSVQEKIIFKDNEKTSSFAKDSVTKVQMAGLISGKNDNMFDPKGTATRAEVAAVLYRFVEMELNG